MAHDRTGTGNGDGTHETTITVATRATWAGVT
jgi:hypothetical protein